MGDDGEVGFLTGSEAGVHKGCEHKRHKREDTKSTRHAGQGWHAVAYHPAAYASFLFLNEELMHSGKKPNPSGFPEFLMKRRPIFLNSLCLPVRGRTQTGFLLFKRLLPPFLALNCRTPCRLPIMTLVVLTVVLTYMRKTWQNPGCNHKTQRVTWALSGGVRL
jgi:hypothetical protein